MKRGTLIVFLVMLILFFGARLSFAGLRLYGVGGNSSQTFNAFVMEVSKSLLKKIKECEARVQGKCFFGNYEIYIADKKPDALETKDDKGSKRRMIEIVITDFDKVFSSYIEYNQLDSAIRMSQKAEEQAGFILEVISILEIYLGSNIDYNSSQPQAEHDI